jgi:thioesterase domain-containing protein
LFSGGGGFGFFYHDLASKAGPDQPMHVFNAIGADSEMESLPLSIEEMAAIYEPEIVAMCPAGPLAIGGYSFGSLLAYELSKRLMAHGREVSLLISFDGPAPGYPRKLALLPRLVEHLRKLCTLGAHQRRAYLRDRWVNLKQRLEPMEDHPLLAPPPGMNEVMAQRLRKLSANLAMARNLYHPVGQVACPVLLLRAEQPVAWPGHVLPDDYGWTDFSETPVSIEVVPGSHLKLFNEENNRTMAQVIKQRLVPGGMR